MAGKGNPLTEVFSPDRAEQEESVRAAISTFHISAQLEKERLARIQGQWKTSGLLTEVKAGDVSLAIALDSPRRAKKPEFTDKHPLLFRLAYHYEDPNTAKLDKEAIKTLLKQGVALVREIKTDGAPMSVIFSMTRIYLGDDTIDERTSWLHPMLPFMLDEIAAAFTAGYYTPQYQKLFCELLQAEMGGLEFMSTPLYPLYKKLTPPTVAIPDYKEESEEEKRFWRLKEINRHLLAIFKQGEAAFKHAYVVETKGTSIHYQLKDGTDIRTTTEYRDMISLARFLPIPTTLDTFFNFREETLITFADQLCYFLVNNRASTGIDTSEEVHTVRMLIQKMTGKKCPYDAMSSNDFPASFELPVAAPTPAPHTPKSNGVRHHGTSPVSAGLDHIKVLERAQHAFRKSRFPQEDKERENQLAATYLKPSVLQGAPMTVNGTTSCLFHYAGNWVDQKQAAEHKQTITALLSKSAGLVIDMDGKPVTIISAIMKWGICGNKNAGEKSWTHPMIPFLLEQISLSFTAGHYSPDYFKLFCELLEAEMPGMEFRGTPLYPLYVKCNLVPYELSPEETRFWRVKEVARHVLAFLKQLEARFKSDVPGTSLSTKSGTFLCLTSSYQIVRSFVFSTSNPRENANAPEKELAALCQLIGEIVASHKKQADFTQEWAIVQHYQRVKLPPVENSAAAGEDPGKEKCVIC